MWGSMLDRCMYEVVVFIIIFYYYGDVLEEKNKNDKN